jgi:O-antigen/teichoic acid export membrane protein
MNLVNKNIVANYIGKLWNFISIFIFVRFYIEILGIQSYAIINFYAVILGLLAFADSGLTVTLNRELAKENSLENKANLLFTFQRIYFFICMGIILLLFIFSNYISLFFLKSNLYKPSEISYFLKLIGIGVSLQLFSTLYEGGLMGLQKHVLVNKINVIWSFFRSGIVLIPLILIPSIKTYFLWQILCNLVLLLVFRFLLWRELASNSKKYFSLKLLSTIWRFALGMMGIAFISAINIQIDKLVTSRILDLKTFGYYSIAATISQVPLLIATPIIISIFPVLTNFVSVKNFKHKIDYFHRFSFIITALITPVVGCVFIYAKPLVTLWTGNALIGTNVDLTVKILVIGGFFLCLQLVPYYVALANGHTKTNIILGGCGLVIIVPLIIFFVKEYGMIGAGFSWVLINFFSWIIMSAIVIHKFLPNQFFKWIYKAILLPTVTTFICTVLIYFLTYSFAGKFWFMLNIGFITISSLFANISLYNIINPTKKLVDFSTFKFQK